MVEIKLILFRIYTRHPYSHLTSRNPQLASCVSHLATRSSHLETCIFPTSNFVFRISIFYTDAPVHHSTNKKDRTKTILISTKSKTSSCEKHFTLYIWNRTKTLLRWRKYIGLSDPCRFSSTNRIDEGVWLHVSPLRRNIFYPFVWKSPPYTLSLTQYLPKCLEETTTQASGMVWWCGLAPPRRTRYNAFYMYTTVLNRKGKEMPVPEPVLCEFHCSCWCVTGGWQKRNMEHSAATWWWRKVCWKMMWRPTAGHIRRSTKEKRCKCKGVIPQWA